jgi:hypothetical protein
MTCYIRQVNTIVVDCDWFILKTFVFLNMYPVNGPEVILPFAQDKFDANGNITDENTKPLLEV